MNSHEARPTRLSLDDVAKLEPRCLPMRLLDPKIDIVFKVLLTRNERLLKSVIESVLGVSVRSLRLLNPDIEKDLAAEKGAVLDVRVEHHDGTQVDLEMQGEVYPALRKRILYYWARCYASELQRGDEHGALRPAIAITWLRESLLNAPRFHSVVRACEIHDHEVFCRDFELHLLELENSDWHPVPRRCNVGVGFFASKAKVTSSSSHGRIQLWKKRRRNWRPSRGIRAS